MNKQNGGEKRKVEGKGMHRAECLSPKVFRPIAAYVIVDAYVLVTDCVLIACVKLCVIRAVKNTFGSGRITVLISFR